MKIYKSDIDAIRKNQATIAAMARLARKLRVHNYDRMVDIEHRIKQEIDDWEIKFVDFVKELRKEKY